MTTSVTHLLWRAAGAPKDVTDKDGDVDAFQTTTPGVRCWWCGEACPDGWVRSIDVLPPTFPHVGDVACPWSPFLCLPCGWTLSDRVRLPAKESAQKIKRRCEVGGRLTVCVDGAPAARWLVLQLKDGNIGLWTPASSAKQEERWKEQVDSLREQPTNVGPCVFIRRVTLKDLQPDATEKFRSYHHMATSKRWTPFTDADRLHVRKWLLDPPEAPWCIVVGDGKKHAAIEAQRFDALTRDNAAPVVWYRGVAVRYTVDGLAEQLAAMERLMDAGASDAEIDSGIYYTLNLDLLAAVRECEPVMVDLRGSPAFGLVKYLRVGRTKTTKE